MTDKCDYREDLYNTAVSILINPSIVQLQCILKAHSTLTYTLNNIWYPKLVDSIFLLYFFSFSCLFWH